MKAQTRLYTIYFPIWILWVLPPILFLSVLWNLIIACLAPFLALLVLKHPQKGRVIWALQPELWLRNLAARLAGTAWMLLSSQLTGFLVFVIRGSVGIERWGEAITDSVLLRPWSHPIGFFVTLAGIAVTGVCIYFSDRRILRKCELLSDRERHIIALVTSVAAAPWFFLAPVY